MRPGGNRYLFVIVGCSLLTLPPPAALAGWSEQGIPIGAPAWGTESPGISSGYRGDDGAFLVKLNGSRYMIERVGADGGVQWQTEVPFASGDGSTYQPGFVPDGLGGCFALGGLNISGTGTTVCAHYSGVNGGEDWGTPGTGASVGTLGYSQSVAVDGSGGAWAAYGTFFSIGLVYLSDGLFMEHLLAGGSTAPGWDAPGRAVSSAGMNPVLAPDGAGGVFLLFEDGSHYLVTHVLPSGSAAPGWTLAGLVLGPTVSYWLPYCHKPFLVPSGADHFIALWDEGMGYVFAQRFGTDGALDPAWPAGGLALQAWWAPGYPLFALPDGLGGVHLLTWNAGPNWMHILASGAFAPGHSAGGISPMDAAAVYANTAHRGFFSAAPGPDGGLVFAWDDARASSPPSIRLRWLRSDGTNDPNEPDSGRVIPGPGPDGSILALIPDGAGGAHAVWSRYAGNNNCPVYMNHMARSGLVLSADPPARSSRLALERPWPNPARDAITVRCALPDDGPATISLFDVGGRRVRGATLAGAGTHTSTFDALGGLPPGVYMVRLAQGGTYRSARVALMR